ncbi:Ig-like domain-containing protein [Chitinivibrio alkaliphilus]|uniref:SbsA Ig-like domain-containing protein n=1 Tax=Chitinivibrio alkaliphilus ACht1 TaxID=1313304 RepID=U7DA70_9BACT|nr:Ig-like domain-containing protein [Chitinivibrio alkaliphilus]ERP32022.1 hypothetical protein CALK_1003 [Chitinivibrio alkaliphilus ACht1]
MIRLILLGALLWTGCAQRQFPEGGDGTPPVLSVIHTHPSQQAVQVSPDSPITIRFSTWPHRDRAAAGIEISPPVPEGVTVDIRRSTMTIHPRTSWEEETTYHIHLTPNLAGYQQAALSPPYTLIFSTGDSLSSGTLSGTIPPHTQEEFTQIGLISTQRLKEDSLVNISTFDYRATPDSTGTFSAHHLSEGTYLCLAVAQWPLQAGDTLYSSSSPAMETSAAPTSLSMPLVYEPRPVEPEAITYRDSTHLELTLTRPLLPRDSALMVSLSREKDTMPLDKWSRRDDGRALHISLPSPLTDTTYEIHLHSHRFPCIDTNRRETTVHSLPFSGPPPSEFPPIHMTKVEMVQRDKTPSLRISWNTAVQKQSPDSIVALQPDGDTLWFIAKESRLSSTHHYTAETPAPMNSELAFTLAWKDCRTEDRDTTITTTTRGTSDFAESFTLIDATEQLSETVLELRGHKTGLVYRKKITDTKTTIAPLRADTYTMRFFGTPHEDTTFRTGTLLPFAPESYYLPVTDTISIPPRWEQEYHFSPETFPFYPPHPSAE